MEGIVRVLDQPAKPNLSWNGDNPDAGTSNAPWRIYNIGSNSPVKLLDYINALEKSLGVEADKELLPIQQGDVPDTFADVDDLIKEFDYKPSMPIQEGIENFAKWYKKFYNC